MTTTQILLWDVLPYVAITTFVVGTIWRYRYDKFGWTTRSSQLYERKLIRIASPLFHIGILAVLGGHIVGLLIPESWTEAVGISECTYHAMAVGLGLFAGAATLIGIVLLIYRRRTVGPGLCRDHEERQDDVRLPGCCDLPGPADDAGRCRRDRRRPQLPRGRVGVVPLHRDPPAPGRADGRRAAVLPGPCRGRDAGVHDLAVHTAGACVLRPPGLRLPALRRLPRPRPARPGQPAPRAAAGRRSAPEPAPPLVVDSVDPGVGIDYRHDRRRSLWSTSRSWAR